MSKRITSMPPPRAVAWWSPELGLCRWAEPEGQALETKPSPECRGVQVRIITEGDYRRLLSKADENGET